MDAILIQGGRTLSGHIDIAGSKNACLAIMPATLLTDDPLTLLNVPRLSDVDTMTTLLQSLGSEVQTLHNNQVRVLVSHAVHNYRADYHIVRKMRAGILVLGPLLARFHQAKVSLPGGCAIGARPVGLHLQGLEALGATLDLRDGYVHATASGGLRGGRFRFPQVSVGATENVLMAATLAKGTSVLDNVATEPEITDLVQCLQSMGAQIKGTGTSQLVVQGVKHLHGATYRVSADRIEFGTYMLAAAIAGGEIELRGGDIGNVRALLDVFTHIGVDYHINSTGLTVKRTRDRLKATSIVTNPYPQFPTDLQAQIMAVLTMAKGTSRIKENVFENRFMHVPELNRMGANISIASGVATIEGVQQLRAAPVMATDLRASVSLVLAALGAMGETRVRRVYHLDRGYEALEEKLSACGALIQRVQE